MQQGQQLCAADPPEAPASLPYKGGLFQLLTSDYASQAFVVVGDSFRNSPQLNYLLILAGSLVLCVILVRLLQCCFLRQLETTTTPVKLRPHLLVNSTGKSGRTGSRSELLVPLQGPSSTVESPERVNTGTSSTGADSPPLSSSNSSVSTVIIQSPSPVRATNSLSNLPCQRDKGHRWRHLYCAIVLFLVLGALTSSLILLALSAIVGHELVLQVNDFPRHVKVTQQTLLHLVNQTLHDAIDIAFHHIVNNPHPYLDIFVDNLTCLVGKSLVYFVNQSSSKTNASQLDLLPQNASFNDHLDPIVKGLVFNFTVVVKRLHRLDKVAAQLTTNWIRQTSDHRYKHQHNLALLMTLGGDNFNTTALDSTRNLLCEALTSRTLTSIDEGSVVTCDQLDTILVDPIQQHANYFAFNSSPLSRRHLSEVVQFTLIPKGLHVDEELRTWLPVVADMPRTGLGFLVKQYSTNALDKISQYARSAIYNADLASALSSMNQVEIYIALFFVILFTLYLSLLVLLFIELLMLRRPFYTSLSGASPNHCVNLSPEKHLAHRHDRSTFTSCVKYVYFGVITVFAIILVVSFLLVYVSVVIEREGCAYAFQGRAQGQADCLISRFLTEVVVPNEIQPRLPNIAMLNLVVPNFILRTFDTIYQPGHSSPILSSLGMTKPVNLSALVNSDWLNTTLQTHWLAHVDTRLREINISAWIKQLEILNSFSRTHPVSVLRKSYDDLYVGPVTDYLDNPGPNKFKPITAALGILKTKLGRDNLKLTHLHQLFHTLSGSHAQYSEHYRLAAEALREIVLNKYIIGPLTPLIDVGVQVFTHLQSTSNEQLYSFLNHIPTQGWDKMRAPISDQVVPFLYTLMDKLVPMPNLRLSYHRVLQPLCSLPRDSPALVQISANSSTLTSEESLILSRVHRLALILFGSTASILLFASILYHGLISFG